MPDVLVEDVLGDASALLQEPTAEIFTPTLLEPFYQMAYTSLWNLMMQWGLPRPRRIAHVILPAYRNSLAPQAEGILDFSEPVEIWERLSPAQVVPSAITNAAPRVVTATAHGFTTGEGVILSGASLPAVNREWFVTTLTDDTFSLNGSLANGVATGGVITRSAGPWKEVFSSPSVGPAEARDRLHVAEWREGILWFAGASVPVLLRMRYVSSGTPPLSGYVGIDNARSFLANYTAAQVAPVYGMPNRGEQLLFAAVGKSGEPDGSGGFLRQLVQPMLLEKRNRPQRAQPMRRRTVWI